MPVQFVIVVPHGDSFKVARWYDKGGGTKTMAMVKVIN